MPFTVAVAGTALKLIQTDGTITTITLPSGVGIVENEPARFAILGRNVIIANAVSEPIWIDPTGAARVLSLTPPAFAPTLAAGAAGALTGTFQAAVSFAIKDDAGNVLLETTRSPLSSAVTVAAQLIAYSNISLSGELANCRRVYRTTDGPGDELFLAFDLDDNTTTSYTDDASDEALSTLPAPDDLGTAPKRLKLLTEWKGHLWGVDYSDVDALLASTLNKHYAWPIEQNFPVAPIGKDTVGIAGFLPRRDELGIAKRNVLWKMIGSTIDDFALRKVVEGKDGTFLFIAPDSPVIIRDVARWLGSTGVFEWDAEGVRSITDDKVAKWFTTDDYFNRALFPLAFGRYEPVLNHYQLLLALAGATTLTHWISYDIESKTWWGPHKSDFIVPTCAGVVLQSTDVMAAALGGNDGFLYVASPGVFHDHTATAIALDGQLGPMVGSKGPDYVNYWGEIFIASKVLAGGSLTITPKVGNLDAAAQPAITHSLTTGRQRLRRLGAGRFAQLQLTDSTVDRENAIYGMEIPHHVKGRR